MNAKFFFILLAIAIFTAACTPAIVDSSVPVDPAQPADNEIIAPVPVTSDSVTIERTEAEPRLWSGEDFLSDSNQPDHMQNLQAPADQNIQNGCFSEDSQPRPQSGCVE